MGGAAVAAAVHYAGQATPISHKGWWSTKKKREELKTYYFLIVAPEGLH